jgi:hypothetical protein
MKEQRLLSRSETKTVTIFGIELNSDFVSFPNIRFSGANNPELCYKVGNNPIKKVMSKKLCWTN